MKTTLASSTRAGVAYAVAVFAVGFFLGTVRTLLLAPRVGATIAVSVETPFILAASWYASRFSMRRFAIGPEIRVRILAGAVAFITLMSLEVALSSSLFHRSLGEFVEGLRSPAGLIGLTAQVIFATFPLLDTFVRR